MICKMAILNIRPNFVDKVANGNRKPSQQQVRFLKQTRGVNILRFQDRDGDMVINGLDCQYKNRRRHGGWTDRINVGPTEERGDYIGNHQQDEAAIQMLTPKQRLRRLYQAGLYGKYQKQPEEIEQDE